MTEGIKGSEGPGETEVPEQEKKSFQFDLAVSPEQLQSALYNRDIDASWEEAKKQIFVNLTDFLVKRGRKIDLVEMRRIDQILEGADEDRGLGHEP